MTYGMMKSADFHRQGMEREGEGQMQLLTFGHYPASCFLFKKFLRLDCISDLS
jgi:hypothetical protein